MNTKKTFTGLDILSVASAICFLIISLAISLNSSAIRADIKNLEEVLTSSTTTVVEEVEPNLIEPQACVAYPFGTPVPKAFSYSSGFWYYENQVIASVKSEDADFSVCGSVEYINEIQNLPVHSMD